VPPTSRFKHLERQTTLSALNDAKGVFGTVATPLGLPGSASTEQPKSLSGRAKEAERLWFSRLPYKERARLKMSRSRWGRDGGSIIALGVRHGRTARRNKKLKRERQARFKAEQFAYEARRSAQDTIKD
jgi:hypothetical protein